MTVLRAYPSTRGIGGDNRLVITDGFDHWNLIEWGSDGFCVLHETFRTRGGAVRRANELLLDEQTASGIEHEFFN